MSLLFSQVKKIVAPYQGKGGKVPTDELTHDFAIKVLQYLLISGSANAEIVIELYAVNGVITAPYELETPLKVKINGRVGTVMSKWFDFRSRADFSPNGCFEAADTLQEDPNTYFTAYDLPVNGAKVGVTAVVDEDPDATITISGQDPTGREIFTNHKGAEIAGEVLEIKKGQTTWSNVTFGKIDGIYKSKTKGYTPFYWKDGALKGFLSDFSPVEEIPAYRRYKLNIPNCPSHAKISILGRVRVKPRYSDNDRVPFDNLYTIEVAAQQVNANYNDRNDTAKQKDNFLQDLNNRDATHRRVSNGQPLEVFYDTSAGTIRGLVK
jgi:hypothetical protein